ncbi:MAG TPA: hypothetical protein VE173_12110, partial [Longimicrobiales bacterium]|nr:hypothetical protein [Longimicrobiales bacterium]
AITGASVALHRALTHLVEDGVVDTHPMLDVVAAVSVGLVDGRPVLDLDYREDASAQVDMNIVGTGSGELVEIQGTAEGHPFTRNELTELLDLGMGGIAALVRAEKEALGLR